MLSFLQNVLQGDEKNRHSEVALIDESVTKSACLAWRLPRDSLAQIPGSSGSSTILTLVAGTSMSVSQNSICDLTMSFYPSIGKSEFTRSARTS